MRTVDDIIADTKAEIAREDAVDVSALLANGRPLPAWMNDREFLAIIAPGIEAAHERYRDPKNRKKGPMPDALGPAWELVVGELDELCEENLNHRAGDGDPEGTRWECGDVILTVANLCRVYAEQGK